MTMEERVARINELYHKSQTAEGLSDAEREEQQRLRQEYVAAVRGNLRAQLDRIDIVEQDGSITNLGKKHGRKS